MQTVLVFVSRRSDSTLTAYVYVCFYVCIYVCMLCVCCVCGRWWVVVVVVVVVAVLAALRPSLILCRATPITACEDATTVPLASLPHLGRDFERG